MLTANAKRASLQLWNRSPEKCLKLGVIKLDIAASD
jgi:hypothetical protein